MNNNLLFIVLFFDDGADVIDDTVCCCSREDLRKISILEIYDDCIVYMHLRKKMRSSQHFYSDKQSL